MNQKDTFANGIVLLTEATQLDGQGNLQQAVAKYREGIRFLRQCTANPTVHARGRSPDDLVLIDQKANEYEERCKILEQRLGPSTVSAASAQMDAIAFLHRASECENAGDEEGQLKWMSEALSLWISEMKAAKDPGRKKELTDLIGGLMDEAEGLKKRIQTRKQWSETSQAVRQLIEKLHIANQLETDRHWDRALAVYRGVVDEAKRVLQQGGGEGQGRADLRTKLNEARVHALTRIQVVENVINTGAPVASHLVVPLGLKPGETYVDPTPKKQSFLQKLLFKNN